MKHLLTRREILSASIKCEEKQKILNGILDNYEKHVVPVMKDVSEYVTTVFLV